MREYAIVLADDHQMFRDGMKRLIEDKEGLVVTGEAGDGWQLLELLSSQKVDMAIIDISMPNLQGLEAGRKIKKKYAQIKLLALTMHRNEEYLHHALSVGFDGYLLKEDSDVELMSAIEAIRAGERYITKQFSADVETIDQAKMNTPDMLSLRELEVLELIAVGKSNKMISEEMNISIRTVENHRAKIMKKLNLRRVADLVRYAIQKELIQVASMPDIED